ncbi:glycoside hydrolase family 95 protein [Vallitalea okinawensis]|uniref:glycoside hydrolase family 95 protein n=1 Tax=Vallitalea okinawensis TaxID=2078660 RepID=UPI000CFE0083|nr:glycoside hydrolase family 95 protein [Vallitalea okinawensis]
MNQLYFEQPASSFNEAFPIGNGRLGGMVFGSPFKEVIQLNEDTFWSGTPLSDHYDVKEHLPHVKKLIDNQQITEAQEYLNKNMLGHWTQNYLPLGNLNITMSDHFQANQYKRWLDLENGTANVQYNVHDTTFTREIFCSHPDQVMVIRLISSKKNNLKCKITLDSQVHYKTYSNNNYLRMIGQAPTHVDPVYDMSDTPVVYDANNKGIAAGVIVQPITDGHISYHEDALMISNATSITLLVACRTNFEDYDQPLNHDISHLETIIMDDLNRLLKRSFDEIYNRHIEDFKGLYNRTSLQLSKESNMPTSQLVLQSKKGNFTPELIELLFSFGRYLIISSSRSGSQATNLQGIWNDMIHAPWCSNYTININTQMNYWPVDVCNLSECFDPLLSLITDLSNQGESAAKGLGCEGWTAHHNTDLWRQCIPVSGNGQYAFWPFGGPWLTTHLMSHYEFNRDNDYLYKVYPIIKGAAEFCMSWVFKDDEGYYITSPSTSPENRYLNNEGEKCFLSKGTTMDISITWEVLNNCLDAIHILDIDEDQNFVNKLKEIREQLLPYKIGLKGNLQEWLYDFEDSDPGHRHLSHLLGLYPGNRINSDADIDLLKACEKSLAIRAENGSGHTSWSCAWFILLYARLRNDQQALHFANKFTQYSLEQNLLSSHPPFQIDGNFGFTAGIAEMLLQSHNDYIEVLPALPSEWSEGNFKGLKARGNVIVDAEWTSNRVHTLKITANDSGNYTIKVNGNIINVTCKTNETLNINL